MSEIIAMKSKYPVICSECGCRLGEDVGQPIHKKASAVPWFHILVCGNCYIHLVGLYDESDGDN